MYDGDGKLEQWWTNTTADHFVEKSQCFIDQYSGFTVKGPNNEEAHVNGKVSYGQMHHDLSVSPPLHALSLSLMPDDAR